MIEKNYLMKLLNFIKCKMFYNGLKKLYQISTIIGFFHLSTHLTWGWLTSLYEVFAQTRWMIWGRKATGVGADQRFVVHSLKVYAEFVIRSPGVYCWSITAHSPAHKGRVIPTM